MWRKDIHDSFEHWHWCGQCIGQVEFLGYTMYYNPPADKIIPSNAHMPPRGPTLADPFPSPSAGDKAWGGAKDKKPMDKVTTNLLTRLTVSVPPRPPRGRKAKEKKKPIIGGCHPPSPVHPSKPPRNASIHPSLAPYMHPSLGFPTHASNRHRGWLIGWMVSR